MATAVKLKTAGVISRRQALAGISATSTLALMSLSGSAAAATDADAFLELSRNLVGKSDLGEDIAARMLAAFENAGRGDAVAALINGSDEPQLSNDIVAAWYSGSSPDPESAEVVTYQDALMWRAMDYTKPMAVCGGEMGYWAGPPAT